MAKIVKNQNVPLPCRAFALRALGAILGYSLTMLGWTGSGQKSNLCQGFVQALSRLCPRTKKYRVCPAHDQAWSTVCQASAHFHTPWTGFGHRHPEFVQALSTKLKKSHFPSLDKLWTDFGPGKPIIRVHIFMIRKKKLLPLDRVWTTSGHGQTLDTVWISAPLLPNCVFYLFSLDRRWKAPGHGLTLDIHAVQHCRASGRKLEAYWK